MSCQRLCTPDAAGHFAQATASLYKLRGLLAKQQQPQGGGGGAGMPSWVSAMLGLDATWKAEEAKLLWAQVGLLRASDAVLLVVPHH